MKRNLLLTLVALTALLMVPAVPVFAGDDYPDDIVYTEPVVGVIFSHQIHVEEYGMDCETCHDDIFQMEAKAAQEEPDFNMKALAQGRYCGACHDGEMAFDANSRCATCHIGVIGYNRLNGVDVASEGH